MTPTTLEIARKFAEELVGNYDTARLILTLADQVESLTKERDAAMTSKDKFFDESVKHRQERDEYKQRMQRLMTTVTELKKERDFLAIANKDLSEAMENYQQLPAAAKLALEALELALACDPKICKCSGQRAIAALRRAGVQ